MIGISLEFCQVPILFFTHYSRFPGSYIIYFKKGRHITNRCIIRGEHSRWGVGRAGRANVQHGSGMFRQDF
jgi:hypothetical protein